MKQPPRSLYLFAAVLVLLLAPAPHVGSGQPGGAGRQATPVTPALASALEELEVGLAGSFPTVSTRRPASGQAAMPPASVWLPLMVLLAVLAAGFRAPAGRHVRLTPSRGPPAA